MANKNLRSRVSIELLAEGYLDEDAVLDEEAVESSLFYVDQDTGILYVRVPGVDGAEDTWVSQGGLVNTYASNPANVGTTSPGTAGALASRGDHVHGHGDQGTLASAHDAVGIDVVDAAGHFAATDVEGVLAELGATSHYHHSQGTAATTWVIPHNLGRYPAVTVLDSGGSEVEVSVLHDSINQATLTLSYAISGIATCS